MANTITVTTNAANFTIAYNSIQQDWGFNDLSFFLNSADNRFVDIVERSTDTRKYRMDIDIDTLDVNGTTVFADASALATALRSAMFSVSAVQNQVGISTFDWKYSSDITATDPGIGFAKFDSLTPAIITKMYMSATNGVNQDGTPFILALTSGDTILVAQDNDGEKFVLLQVLADPTDNTGWFTIPVMPIATGLIMDDQEDIGIQFTYTGTVSGGGVQSVTGDGVDNTDPMNPVMAFPTPNQIGLFVPAFGELFRGSKGTQTLPAAGEVIVFDNAGVSSGVNTNAVSGELQIVTPGIYRIEILAEVDLDGSTDYAHYVRVNGANVRQIANLEGAATQKPASVGKANLNLVANDVVSLFVIPSINNKDFELEIGSTFSVTRIG